MTVLGTWWDARQCGARRGIVRGGVQAAEAADEPLCGGEGSRQERLGARAHLVAAGSALVQHLTLQQAPWIVRNVGFSGVAALSSGGEVRPHSPALPSLRLTKHTACLFSALNSPPPPSLSLNVALLGVSSWSR